MTVLYGSVDGAEPARRSGHVRRSRIAALMGVLSVAVLVAVVVGAHGQRTVLDDKVEDPLAGMASLDETPHEWTDEHGDGYDPEKQNVWAEEGAFDPPFVGYAKKDLKWRAPAEPETNALDYLPSGKFSEPKSMELRSLLGPYPAPRNVWAEGVTLDY